MESVFQPFDNSPADPDQFVVEVKDDFPIKHVSPKEVPEINHLKSKKAPGFDYITVQMLKKLPTKGIMKLTHLFNASIRLRYFPKQWKIAEVIAIPKPGKPPNVVTSYRPISLLPIIAKVYEKIINKRLKLIIEANHLVPVHQFGFRDKHSTID